MQTPAAPNEVLFQHGSVTIRILAAGDLDSQLTEGLDAERIPYWSVLWEAGFGLSRWVVEQGGWTGVPVLELGCGAGLVGLAAAAMGARVTQTDLFLDAVVLARLNAQRNGLTSALQLTADWRAWPLVETWPVILGSDITYDRSVHTELLSVLDRALAEGGRVVLADPGRPMTLDFLTRAEQEGWKVRIEDAPVAPGERAGFLYHLDRHSRAGSHLCGLPRARKLLQFPSASSPPKLAEDWQAREV